MTPSNQLLIMSDAHNPRVPGWHGHRLMENGHRSTAIDKPHLRSAADANVPMPARSAGHERPRHPLIDAMRKIAIGDEAFDEGKVRRAVVLRCRRTCHRKRTITLGHRLLAPDCLPA